MPSSDRPRAVLFVDICDSTRLYESLGDKLASETVLRCLERLKLRVEESNGQVIQRIGDELMCVFDTADAALDAARIMQESVSSHEGSDQPTLAIRVGCHFGAVIESGGDLFGDSVNVASRAATFAHARQVITTEETVTNLSSALRDRIRPLGAFTIKGKREDLAMYEFIWQDSSESTIAAGTRSSLERPTRLRLKYAGRELYLEGRSHTPLTLGRDAECDLVIPDPKASRLHARIETRQSKFVLIDQSVNGTYVTIGTQDEIVLRREELLLYAGGGISLGHRAGDGDIGPVEFLCE